MFIHEYTKIYIQPFLSLHRNSTYGGEILIRNKFGGGGEETINTLREIYSDSEIDIFIIIETLRIIESSKNSTKKLFPLHINLLENTLIDSAAILTIISVLNNYRDLIVLELNERTDFHNSTVQHNIEALTQQNFKLALDDCNESSQLDVNIFKYGICEIKIKKAGKKEFSKKDIKVLSKINRLCNSLNITLVIEGVETETQLSELKKLGINIIQGYVYSAPLPIVYYINMY